jgi:hypothetical protein
MQSSSPWQKLDDLHSRGKRYCRILRAYLPASRQLTEIRKLPHSPFNHFPRDGYLRGIDFYDESGLTSAMALTMAKFRKSHGILPNLVEPTGFNEKIVWSKFFAEFKIPESGNKLLTHTFIPPDIQGLIQCPGIVWHSPKARLPGNDEIPPGYYYLKSNHGCGMFKRIRYPLDDRQRIDLESICRQWLAHPYGLHDGEWWYNIFTREILIEEDVTGGGESLSYNLFVFDGEIALTLQDFKPEYGNHEQSRAIRLGPDFDLHPEFSPKSPAWRSKVRKLPQPLISRMQSCATRIARPFRFARIDFFVGQDGSPYLGEVTFTPNNGCMRRPQALDRYLGGKWNLAGTVPG